MNSKIIETFGKKNENFESEANWLFIPGGKYKGISIVELSKDKWLINDNGEVTEGDNLAIIKKCIEIVKRENEKKKDGI